MEVLVDAHCHCVVAGDVDATAFERWCTEADLPAPAGVSYLDSQLGFAVRRWCAPVLDLPAHAPVAEYLARRAELGWREAGTRLLRAAGLGALLVDTGLSAGLVGLAELSTLAGVPVHEVVRLERVAEELNTDAAGFAAAYATALHARVAGAVAVKSVIAYRHGLDTGLPLQLHTGFGDRDLPLSRADPALAQPFLAAVSSPVVLLHGYPYHRQAGWLALVYPHVYADVGLTLNHLGARAPAVLGEFCELVPAGKLLFSTDACGLPELYLTGAAQYRHALRVLLDGWVADGALSTVDADRTASAIGAGNARRLYRLS